MNQHEEMTALCRDENCPVCGSEKLWGPAEVIVDEGTVHEYVDCARCHTLCLIVDGKPVAKARAW